MKEFAMENKKYIKKFARKMDSIHERTEQSSDEAVIEEENIEKEKLEKEDEGTISFRNATIVFLLLLLIMGILYFSGEKELASQCMEEFNNYQCDQNNPSSNLCNELYDCIIKERGKHYYQG